MTEPGIYRNLPFDEYRAIPAINPSSAVDMLRSPKHYKWRRDNPQPATKPQEFGTAIHCAVLEPDEFSKRYVFWPEARRGSAWTEFKAAHADVGILTQGEYDTCLAARDSVRAHPAAGPLLDGLAPDDTEVSVVWDCLQTGMRCKGRVDTALYYPPRIILDLKTTGIDISDDYALRREASTLHWDIRLAAYQDGISTFTGTTPDVKVIVVEQKPPHDVRVLNVNDAVLSFGWDKWVRLLGQIRESEESGHWPGCHDEETDLHVWMDGEV